MTTNIDIREQVINPTIGAEFDEDTLDAITDALLEAAPVSTWSLDSETMSYTSTAIDTDGYWALVEQVATSRA